MKNIIFDFDGVIIDSMRVRSYGFEKIFRDFDSDKVKKIVEYHNNNGGLSRFIKIKYFFNEVLKREISNEQIIKYAREYSDIMKDNLTSKDIIIDETVQFIVKYYHNFNMHIASGSEESELRYLNQVLELENYFKSIYGSPTTKIELVDRILSENKYKNEETILIGDSINDYEAAKENKIGFFGYNNILLERLGKGYINNFKEFESEIF